jgi:hypothetical protein
MYNQDKVEKAVFKTVSLWLLEHPPLQEVGGFISQVIEGYREGAYTKIHALKILEVEHREYIERYIQRAKEIALEQTY